MDIVYKTNAKRLPISVSSFGNDARRQWLQWRRQYLHRQLVKWASRVSAKYKRWISYMVDADLQASGCMRNQKSTRLRTKPIQTKIIGYEGEINLFIECRDCSYSKTLEFLSSNKAGCMQVKMTKFLILLRFVFEVSSKNRQINII